jgi:hypothetical protein
MKMPLPFGNYGTRVSHPLPARPGQSLPAVAGGDRGMIRAVRKIFVP